MCNCIFLRVATAWCFAEPIPAAVIVFAVNTGAYNAETIRAAIEAIPNGQLEAGYCAGMSYLQTMRRIILPLALYIEVRLIYLLFSTVLTQLQTVGEKRLGRYAQKETL